MKKLIFVLVILAIPFFSGCASVNVQDENIFPEADPNKALIYFFREKRLSGFAVSYNVRNNEEIIGAIANGTYFYKFMEPGEHTFTASTEAKVSRTLSMNAGETYYISCGVSIGLFAGRPTMAIVNEQEANSVLPQLRYAIKPVAENSK